MTIDKNATALSFEVNSDTQLTWAELKLAELRAQPNSTPLIKLHSEFWSESGTVDTFLDWLNNQ